MANHPIAHLEIPTANVGASGAFYHDVFGWQLETNREHNYTIFHAQGGLRGGFAGPTEPTYEQGKLLIYLTCDDIEGTLATIEAHGGKTILPQTEIPHVGWWAIFADPAGNHLGLYKIARPASSQAL